MDVQTIDQTQAAAPAAAAAASAPAVPPAQPGGPALGPNPAPQQKADETLHRALSHLVGGGSDVTVQFRVEHGPNEIVTVFKNSVTGQVISEFPAEAMVLIAQFFNKVAGAVVDRTA
jgi:hypothetical protein